MAAWFSSNKGPTRSKGTSFKEPFDPRRPLLYFTQTDPWTIQDATQGTQIFGAIGSGKTSGSGAAIARTFLSAGFGGIVLTAKPDERLLWERYCRETGRSDSLIVFSPDQPWRFNFLDYEFRRPGRGGGDTENLINLFFEVIEMADGGGGRKSSDPFWDRAVKQMLRNAIDLLKVARGTLTLGDLYSVLSSAPNSLAEANEASWQETSDCYKAIAEGDAKVRGTEDEGDFTMAANYWLRDYAALAPETRSVVFTSFTSMADCFPRGKLKKLFCTTTNVLPEHTHAGHVIVLDLPIKEYGEVGRYAQALFKYIWQCATERRADSDNPRPVFLWADEAQFFLTRKDTEFQTTARSSRACTVYLTQNLPNYYMMLGGEVGKHHVDSLVGNLRTKIFHGNDEPQTNKWASELISQMWTRQTSYGTTTGGKDRQGSSSLNTSRAREYRVQPEEFISLRNGGPHNNWEIDSIVFRSTEPWPSSGTHVIRPIFRQTREES